MKKLTESDRKKMAHLFAVEAKRRKRAPDERIERAKKAFKAKPYNLEGNK